MMKLRDSIMAFGPMEGAILVGLFLILFGPSQLPKLARSLGQAKSEFNKGLVEGDVSNSTEEDLERGGKTESVALVDEAKNRGLDVEGKKPEDVKKEIQEAE
jgi:sec-independent protein translocase protein TatA